MDDSRPDAEYSVGTAAAIASAATQGAEALQGQVAQLRGSEPRSPDETFVDIYESDGASTVFLDPSTSRSAPPTTTPEPPAASARLGVTGFSANHRSYDQLKDRSHDTGVQVDNTGTGLVHSWNAGPRAGQGLQHSIDMFLCDGWLSAGYGQTTDAHSWGILVAGWGGGSSFGTLGATFDNASLFATVSANRDVEAERISERLSRQMAPHVGLDANSPVYRLTIRSEISGDLSLGLSTDIKACGSLYYLGLSKGSKWEWSTLVGEQRAHDVVYGREGVLASLADKAKCAGLVLEDVDFRLDRPESLKKGDRVSVTQEGSFSLSAAVGQSGLYGGMQTRAQGTVRTTLVKADDHEFLLFREPLDLKSVSSFVSAGVGAQASAGLATVKSWREAFRFRVDPSNPDDPARRALLDALAGKMPGEAHTIAVPYDAVAAGTHIAKGIAHLALIEEEKKRLPKGVERLFLGSDRGLSLTLGAGLYFFVLPKALLPEKVENTLSVSTTEYGYSQTLARGAADLMLLEHTVGKRDDYSLLINGRHTHNAYATSRWQLEPQGPAQGPVHVGLAPSLTGLTCGEVYDEQRVRTRAQNRYIATQLNDALGLSLSVPEAGGHNESRHVEVKRLFSPQDVLRIGTELSQRATEADAVNTWADSAHLDRAVTRQFLSEAAQLARVHAAADQSERLLAALVHLFIKFFQQHSSKATRLWHEMLGAERSQLVLSTDSDAYSEAVRRSDALVLKYLGPITGDEDESHLMARFDDVMRELTYFREVTREVLDHDPFLSIEERNEMVGEMNAAAQQLRDLVRVDHLPLQTRRALALRLTTEQGVHCSDEAHRYYAADVFDQELTVVGNVDAYLSDAKEVAFVLENTNTSQNKCKSNDSSGAKQALEEMLLRDLRRRLLRSEASPLLSDDERQRRREALVHARDRLCRWMKQQDIWA